MAPAQKCQFRAPPGLVWGAIAAALFLGYTGVAAAREAWLTGEPLREALSQKVTVVWSNIPVRQAMEGLCNSQNMAILLDCRIDPDRKIEFSLDDVPLSEAMKQIATRLEVGTTMLGPVAYFGPAATANRLRRVAALRRQEVEKLPQAVRHRWMEPHPWKWADLTAPRDLLAALAQEGGATVEGREKVPADQWAQGDFPELTLPEKLTLLLAQFDLTYELSADGSTMRIVAMPENPPPERAEASEQTPSAKPRQRIVTGPARKIYTLQVELPVGQLLQSLGPRMGLDIHIDKEAIAAAGKSLDTKVKLDVKDAGADELLRAVLEPAGLTFVRNGNVVEVQPKK